MLYILEPTTVALQNIKAIDSTSDFFTNLNDEINFFQKKGVTLVQGDLNARTGNAKDFIEYDKFIQQFGIENIHNKHV